MNKWDLYFMGIARSVGNNSRCYSRKIGSILVKDKSIISTGYNGPPRGVPHCHVRNENEEKICPRKIMGFPSGQGLDYCVAGHSERNAIVNAARMGIETKDSILYCDCGIPCKDCLIEIINAGVSEIVFNTYNTTGAAGDHYYDNLSPWLVENSGIKVRGVKYDV